MVKLLGVILIISSLFTLLIGSIIELNYGTNTQITGNVISNILEQPSIQLDFYNYLEAIIFSYSIISLIMGVLFLFRV